MSQYVQAVTASISIDWERVGIACALFLIAWLIGWQSTRLAKRILHIRRFGAKHIVLSKERDETLHSLLASTLTFLSYLVAFLISLAIFIDASTVLWLIGLFSAGFGFAARPLISDYLTGVSLIFEDPFEIGEKIELPFITGGSVEGVVEKIGLRTTLIRARSGETFDVPNGEIRVVRNFSRGKYTLANIKVLVKARDTQRAVDLLDSLAGEAVEKLPNLTEPWIVISETGEIGQFAELTLIAKAKFGTGATLKPRMLGLIQARFEEAGILIGG